MKVFTLIEADRYIKVDDKGIFFSKENCCFERPAVVDLKNLGCQIVCKFPEIDVRLVKKLASFWWASANVIDYK